MSILVKQAGIISAADFLRLFVKTIIGIFLARILTQADYGTYRQLFMIYMLVSAIFMIGLPQSVYYFIPKSDEATRRKFIRQTIDIISILGLLSSLLLILSRQWIATFFNNPHLFKILLIFAFYPFFMFMSQLYYSVMVGLQKPRKAAIYILLSVFSDAILILGTAILTRNLTYITLSIVISVLLQWIYARISLRSQTHSTGVFSYDLNMIKSQFRFSLPIGIAAIIGVVSSQIDKIVISSFFSPEMFAVFSIGATELPFIGIITNSVNAVILPEMSKRTERDSIVGLYSGAVRKNALILFPIFTFCFVFAPHIIQVLYSVKYLGAVPFFRIYLLTMPLRIATYGILFQVFNKTKYIFIVSVITLSLNTLLSLTFIRVFGLKGPALAAAIVTYASVALYLILTKDKLNLKLRNLFPIASLTRTLVAAVTSSGITLAVVFISTNPVYQLIIGFPAFLVVFFIIGRLFKAILPYDQAMIINMIKETVLKLKGVSNA